MSVPLDSLALDTRLRLAELVWTSSPRVGVYWLFAGLLRAQTTQMDYAKVRQALAKASSSGATADECSCISHEIKRLESIQAESTAALLCAQMKKLAEARDRHNLAVTLDNFKRNFGATDFALKNAAQLRTFEIRSAPILLADGLAAYIPFEDMAGNIATEATGLVHDCVISNATWAAGKIGGALNCNGNNSFVPVPNISVKSGTFSLCAWVNHPSGTDHYERYVTLSAETGIIRRNKENHLEFIAKINNKLEFIGAPDSPETNRWYHIVGTFDGKNMRMYRDGVVIATAAHNGKIENVTDATISAQASESMNGLIDDVRIYDRALTEDEIKTLADPKAVKAPSLNDRQ